VAAALGILLQEPHHMLKIGLLSLAGWRETTWHGLNPKQITEAQSHLSPLILLHGECHTQGVWNSLAAAIRKAGIQNPVYTVNLPWGPIQEADYDHIEARIAEIREQYLKWGKGNIQVDLVGYSRGAPLAYMMGFKRVYRSSPISPKDDFRRPDIGKIILLGEVLSPRHLGGTNAEQKMLYETDVYEIVGAFDLLTGGRSVLPPERQCTVECGHLGLPFSPLSHQKIIEWIKGDSKCA
jgi:pimeloyl-ACP methyl ester carboxylesterase